MDDNLLASKLNIVKSAAISVLMGLLLFQDNLFSNSVFLITLTVLIYVFLLKTDRLQSILFSHSAELVFSLLFSISVVLGNNIDNGRDLASLSLSGIGLLIAEVFVCGYISRRIIRLLCSKIVYHIEKGQRCFVTKQSNCLSFFFAFVLIMLCWSLVWLAYYPGLLNYDPWQINQVLSGNYNKDHPLLHTLLLGNTYKYGLSTGNPNNGILLYDIVQATILASIFSFTYTVIKKNTNGETIPIIVLGFYAVNPVNAVMAISTTKDVLFSAFVLLSLLISILLIKEKKSHDFALYVALAFSLTLIALFRSNAIIYIILCTLVSLGFIRKSSWRRSFIILLFSVGLFFSIDSLLTQMLDARQPRITEALSAVAQQFGRIHSNVDDTETKETLEEYIFFNEANYNPVLADSTKSYFKEDVNKKIGQVLICSAKMLWKYKRVSIDSLLYTTKGLWHIGDTSFSKVYGTGTRVGGYIQTCVFDGFDIREDSKIPWLKEMIEALFSDNDYMKIPIVSILFSPAIYMYVYLFVFLLLISLHSKYDICLPFFGFFCITMFLSPCILVRYIYPLMVCAPVFLWLLYRAVLEKMQEQNCRKTREQ